MKPVVIYDQNKMDSVLTAACLSSVMDITPSEARCAAPQSDRYIWLGVYPSRHYFGRDWAEAEKAEHICFTEMVSERFSKHHRVQNAQFVYAVETSDLKNDEAPNVRTFGKATLLERVLEWFKLSSKAFIGPQLYLQEFYKPTASMELLLEVCLNMKEALHCLRRQEDVYTPISVSLSDLSEARVIYEDMVAFSKFTLDHRATTETLVRHVMEDKKKHQRLFHLVTTYEQENFWFVRRLLELRGFLYRNTTVSAIGVQIISNANYTEGLQKFEPSIVF